MKKFKLDNNLAKSIAEGVNNVDAKSSFNIRNIDINLLVTSDKNFYRIEEIEKLAEDIELNGLYHNLIVRKSNNEEGKYEILSGERRYKALKMLYDRGNEKYSKVPCQVRENLNDIDAEIILIQSNAEVRQLSEMEKIKQIERLEELYKEKKKKGEKIPGKLRNKIGQDMGLSGIQVQRYKKIGKDLIPELKEMLESKRIGMAEAFKFSGLDNGKQKALYEFLKVNESASADEAENKVNGNKKIDKVSDSLKEKLLNLEKNNVNEIQDVKEQDKTSEDKLPIGNEEYFNKNQVSINDLNENVPGEDKSNNKTLNKKENINKASDSTLGTVMETSKNLMFIRNNIKSIKKDYLLELQKNIELFLKDLNNYLE